MRVWELAGISGSLVSAQKGDFNQKLQYCLHCILLLSSISLCLTISCLVLSFVSFEFLKVVLCQLYLPGSSHFGFHKKPSTIIVPLSQDHFYSINATEAPATPHYIMQQQYHTITIQYYLICKPSPPLCRAVFLYSYLNMQQYGLQKCNTLHCMFGV